MGGKRFDQFSPEPSKPGKPVNPQLTDMADGMSGDLEMKEMERARITIPEGKVVENTIPKEWMEKIRKESWYVLFHGGPHVTAYVPSNEPGYKDRADAVCVFVHRNPDENGVVEIEFAQGKEEKTDPETGEKVGWTGWKIVGIMKIKVR